MAHLAKKGNMLQVFKFQSVALQLSNALACGLLLLMCAPGTAGAQNPSPRSLDPRLKVELFAENPQIVTPTGIDVDHKGRVWAIESNTHFPPAGYTGHPSDRVLVMSDTDGDGKADKIVVFTDGLKFTMSVAVKPIWAVDPASRGGNPPDGTKPSKAAPGKNARTNPGADTPGSPGNSVYIATRREIRLFHDDDGDDKADRSDQIVHLDTKGDYPHNGLAGFALDALGWLHFGCGENLGADYKLIGSDGTTLTGGGEGGNIFRCRLDGTKLERIATGFWNPHANCFDAFGRLFSVDNDPDSRPPCRLMHIIPGGDYGYRYRNGRKGLHPFTAWNGEIPGTLPMVAGTGEAPSGVLAYESDGLPEEYIGDLFATSWGDHRIDRFRLKPHGASFTSLAEPLIVGDENFRPVGIACAPDGGLYFTDWVKRDYTLHGNGRIWKISTVLPRKAKVVDTASISALPIEEIAELLKSPRLDVRRQAARVLAVAPKGKGRAKLQDILVDDSQPARARIESLWAMAWFSDRYPHIASFNFFPLLKLFSTCDSVAGALGWLLNSPPLPMDELELHKLAEDLVAERIAKRTNRLTDGTALTAVLSRCKLTTNDVLVPQALSIDDPFVLSIMVSLLARDFGPDDFARLLTPGSGAAPRVRMAMLLAARQRDPRDETLLTIGLGDHDPDVRRVAVQWVAEEKLKDLRPRVEAVFNSSAVTADLFMATLASLEMLDGTKPEDIDKTPAAKYVLPLLKDDKRPAAVRAQALRLVSPADPALDSGLLSQWINGGDMLLRQEAIHTLQLAPVERAAPLLIPFAADAGHDKQLRADAVAGLAFAAKIEQPGGAARKLLAQMLGSRDEVFRREGLRSSRHLFAADSALQEALLALSASVKSPAGAGTDADHELADQIVLAVAGQKVPISDEILAMRSKPPTNKAEWLAQLNRGRTADPAAGRRLFYHANGPGCSNCHTVNGRGGRVGPDLSRIVESMNRVQLIQSILEPGSEIAPQYVAWAFETTDGKVLTGMIVHENEGKTIIGDAEGKTTELKTIDIVQRVPQAKSIMPDKLTDLMTLQEFRDLIAFLESLK
jgi:putative membrane-bound dehydrogenase-like protein